MSDSKIVRKNQVTVKLFGKVCGSNPSPPKQSHSRSPLLPLLHAKHPRPPRHIQLKIPHRAVLHPAPAQALPCSSARMKCASRRPQLWELSRASTPEKVSALSLPGLFVGFIACVVESPASLTCSWKCRSQGGL
jgi:hypothetical protein